MHFLTLATLYQQLEATSSGNQLREILSEFFKEVPKDDLGMIAQLSLGKIAADYENVVLGIAEKSILKAMGKASAKSGSEIKKLMQKHGDTGLVAEQLFKHKAQTLVPVGNLEVKELYQSLHKIATLSGTGSQDKKEKVLISLYQKCSGLEAKYLSRIVQGTLRMGVADMTVLDSLTIAFTGDKKKKKELEAAYNICPNLQILATELAHGGLQAASSIPIKVGRPIRVMLAQRVATIAEIMEKIPGKVAGEAKYDGERVQVHKQKDGTITLYSRRMDDITSQFPDIIEHLNSEIIKSAKEYIFEAEIIAVDENGNHRPFHELMKRKRKTDIKEFAKKIPVVLYCFDLLYLNGKNYMQELYPDRTQKLKSLVSKDGSIRFAKHISTNNVEELEAFFTKMLDLGYEGMIAKSQADNSQYKAGARDWAWIKWKKDYVGELSDTFDLVIIGAFYGKGKRSGSYGSLLCATYNPETDTFESISKLGSGLTDKTLNELPEMLKQYNVAKQPARVLVTKEMTPDLWFEPAVVIEVLAAEISRGKMHTCAALNGRGLALRFPRFIQFRDNKSAEQATTSQEVEQMYGK